MKINGRCHKIDPKTRGYELDKVLTTLFGRGTFVYLYVNETTKEFFATDEAVILNPREMRMFSAGQVGVKNDDNNKSTAHV